MNLKELWLALMLCLILFEISDVVKAVKNAQKDDALDRYLCSRKKINPKIKHLNLLAVRSRLKRMQDMHDETHV